MDYLLFDLLVLALPAALLLRAAHGRRRLLGPAAVLATLALAWTGPWDDHLVRTGVWTYDPGAVLARVGAVPLEEYGFVVLEVLLVGAWSLRIGALPRAAAVIAAPSARTRGACAWAAVGALGAGLLLIGGSYRYLGLLLVWAAPPLALQHAVAGDVLATRRHLRLLTAAPVALWLCVADRLALAHGVWTIASGSSTGAALLGLPVEEALFFVLTCLLVTDGLLLASDPQVLARGAALARRKRLTRAASPPRENATSRPVPVGSPTRSASTIRWT